MSRYYTKPLTILASNKLHLIPKMSALRLVETMEDISFWKDKSSDTTVKLFTHCSSRLVSLLQDLKVSEMVRMLYSYNKAGIQVKSFIPKVKEYILNEPETEQTLFNKSCVNDIILLYKGFATNHVFDSSIHNFIIQQIIKQKIHMIESDICLFLKSHTDYLKANTKIHENNNTHPSIESYLYPEFVNDMITQLLNKYNSCIPSDIVCFMNSISDLSHFYKIDQLNLIDSMFNTLSKHPERFSIDQILSLIRSTCKLVMSCYNIQNQMNSEPINFISSILEEIERRNDIMDFKNCLDSFYHLNYINYWNPKLLKGMIYCILNRLDKEEDAKKIYEIILKNDRNLVENNKSINDLNKPSYELTNIKSVTTSFEMKRIMDKLTNIINQNNKK